MIKMLLDAKCRFNLDKLQVVGGVFFLSFLEKYVTEMQASFVCSSWLNDARRGRQIFRYFASQYFWIQNVVLNPIGF